MNTIAAFLTTNIAVQLAEAIRIWWKEESDDWDCLVTGVSPNPLPGGVDLWDLMPVVDSKATARSAPIFEKYLGIPLDIKLIRPGGYNSIDEMIIHLVPAMQSLAAKSQNAPQENYDGKGT